MRALTDMEGIYTYEGSYEVNALVAGRDLTGHAAFVKWCYYDNNEIWTQNINKSLKKGFKRVSFGEKLIYF